MISLGSVVLLVFIFKTANEEKILDKKREIAFLETVGALHYTM